MPLFPQLNYKSNDQQCPVVERPHPGVIDITYDGTDADGSRIARLNRILGYIAAVSENTLKHIVRLHDHKGELSVWWESVPTVESMAAVENAWASCVGDNSWGVHHHPIVGGVYDESVEYSLLMTIVANSAIGGTPSKQPFLPQAIGPARYATRP